MGEGVALGLHVESNLWPDDTLQRTLVDDGKEQVLVCLMVPLRWRHLVLGLIVCLEGVRAEVEVEVELCKGGLCEEVVFWKRGREDWREIEGDCVKRFSLARNNYACVECDSPRSFTATFTAKSTLASYNRGLHLEFTDLARNGHIRTDQEPNGYTSNIISLLSPASLGVFRLSEQ